MAGPQVPTYGETTQRARPMDRTMVDADVFGASIGRAQTGAGAAIQGAGDRMLGTAGAEMLRAKELKEANDVLNGVSEASREMRKALWDGDGAIMTRQGGNAVGATAEFGKVVDDLAPKYAERFKDPKARMAFEAQFRRQADAQLNSVQTHEAGQRIVYRDETTKAVVANAVNAATLGYKDDGVVDAQLGLIEGAIRTNSTGLPPEAVEKLSRDAKSSVFKNILTDIIKRDPAEAKAYFDRRRGDMSGADILDVERMLDAPLRLARASTVADEAMGRSTAHRALSEAVIVSESGGNPNAVSPVGAAGQMQVMPDTARDISKSLGDGVMAGKSDTEIQAILKTDVGRRYGEYYLDKQLGDFKGDVEAALIAYNAGPANAEKWIKAGRDYAVLPKRAETEPYVARTLNRFWASMGGGGTFDNRKDLPPAGQRMTRDNWSLKFYKPEDLTAPSDGGNWVDARSAMMMDEVGRRFFEMTGKRVGVNADDDGSGKTAGRRRGTSDPKDNPHVPNSQHVHGRAFDVQIQVLDANEKAQFLQLAREAGFTGIGFYGDKGHLHLDTGRPRTWGGKPAWATAGMSFNPSGPGATPAARGSVTVTGGGLSTNAMFDPARTAAAAALVAPTATAEAVPAPPVMTNPVVAGVDLSEPDLEGWLARVRADPRIANDPVALAAAERRVTAEASRRNSIAAAHKKRLRQAVFQEVFTNGTPIEKLPPEALAQLDDQTFTALSRIADKRAKGDVVMTPEGRRQKIAFDRMSNDEIKNVDLWERYGEIWDAETINAASARVAGVLRNDEKTLSELGELRSRTAIVDGAIRELGLDVNKNPDDAAKANRLNARVDDEIKAYTLEHKKKPTGDEITKIVDRLIVKDKTTWGMGYAFEVDKAKLGQGGFQAAGIVADIPEASRAHLAETFFTAFRRSPDEKEAVTYYNMGMVAALGGQVPIPAADRKEFMAGLARSLNRPGGRVTEEEALRYYNAWVAKFVRR